MSKASASGSPARSARAAAPTAPPAGPESTLHAPCPVTSSTGAVPPAESITSGSGIPRSSLAEHSVARYRSSSGARYASITVVDVRSNSRN